MGVQCLARNRKFGRELLTHLPLLENVAYPLVSFASEIQLLVLSRAERLISVSSNKKSFKPIIIVSFGLLSGVLYRVVASEERETLIAKVAEPAVRPVHPSQIVEADENFVGEINSLAATGIAPRLWPGSTWSIPSVRSGSSCRGNSC